MKRYIKSAEDTLYPLKDIVDFSSDVQWNVAKKLYDLSIGFRMSVDTALSSLVSNIFEKTISGITHSNREYWSGDFDANTYSCETFAHYFLPDLISRCTSLTSQEIDFLNEYINNTSRYIHDYTDYSGSQWSEGIWCTSGKSIEKSDKIFPPHVEDYVSSYDSKIVKSVETKLKYCIENLMDEVNDSFSKQVKNKLIQTLCFDSDRKDNSNYKFDNNGNLYDYNDYKPFDNIVSW